MDPAREPQGAPAVPATARLTAHPHAPDALVRELVATAAWRPRPGTLSLAFQVAGELDGLKLPAPHGARRADGLWQHTCFEAFVRAEGASSYYEFNFSTSGEWAAYRFTSRRTGMQPEARVAAPRIGILQGQGRLDVSIGMDVAQLDDLAAATRLELGLAVVLERSDGGRSYWALRHGAAQPDFHDPATFVMQLEGRSAA